MAEPKLILGSQSPRRKEILGYFSLPFEQMSPNFDEAAVPFNRDPADYVCELSNGKAQSLAARFSNDIILTADTIVWKEGKIYGKPKNAEEAFQTLSEFADSWHSVFTGITVLFEGRILNAFEETKVLFNPLTPDQIRRYHSKLRWEDKAGGYAIQMAGGLAVKKIDGCYYNVMGLPIHSLYKLLLVIGIDLWNHLK